MKSTALLLLALIALAGCGIHSFEASSKSPELEVEHKADVGPFNSESASETTEVSDYQICLARYEGMTDRAAYCHGLMWADHPSRYQQQYSAGWPYGPYSPYGYPGMYPPDYRLQIYPQMYAAP